MGPLEGIRVVEFANGIHGPYAAMLLADMGADVVKVEPPAGDINRGSAVVEAPYRVGTQYYACNRNKRVMCLNLHDEHGKTIAQELAARADVLIENMRPGVMDRLGLGYESTSTANPRLVYATATGYGSKGPRSGRPSLDIVGQAAGGVVAHSGLPETGPLPAGTAVADHAGAVWLAYGVMLALFARERTGRGQHVQSSLLGSQIGLQAWEMSHFLMTREEPPQGGRGHGLARGAWQIFAAADGHFALAGVTDARWPGLCTAIGRPGLADDPRFSTAQARLDNTTDFLSALAEAFKEQQVDELVAALEASDQIVAKVMDYRDLVADAQVIANGYVAELEGTDHGALPMVGIPIALSETPGSIRSRPPDIDEHTAAVLAELGYQPERIAELYNSGSVGAASAKDGPWA